MNSEIPDVQLDLEKAEEPEIKLPTSVESWKKQESSRKNLLLFIDYTKAFDCGDHNNSRKFFIDENTRPPFGLLRNL